MRGLQSDYLVIRGWEARRGEGGGVGEVKWEGGGAVKVKG